MISDFFHMVMLNRVILRVIFFMMEFSIVQIFKANSN